MKQHWHANIHTETGQWIRMAENHKCTLMRKVNNRLMWKKQLGLSQFCSIANLCASPAFSLYLLCSGLTLFPGSCCLPDSASHLPLTALFPLTTLFGFIISRCHVLWFSSSNSSTQVNLEFDLWLRTPESFAGEAEAFNLFIMYCSILFFHQLHTFPSKRTKVDHLLDRAQLWRTLTLTWPAWLSSQAFKVLWSPRQFLCGPTCDGCVISGRKESKLHILSSFSDSPSYLTERPWHRKNNTGDKCLSSCFLSYQNTKKADETWNLKIVTRALPNTCRMLARWTPRSAKSVVSHGIKSPNIGFNFAPNP